MTCGCGSALPGDVQMEHRSAFAMCWTCPDRAPKRRTPCAVFAEMTVGGRMFNPTGRTCPRGRWPDREGRIVWAGVLWYGVPWILRRRIARERARIARRQAMGPDFLPHCGCVGVLRDTWDALFGEPSFPPTAIDSRTFNYVRGAA